MQTKPASTAAQNGAATITATTTASNTQGSSGSRPVTGRPSAYSDRALEILCTVIATLGVSDSGAASRARISTSTLSRWKREHPELTIALLQAREKFRQSQLDLILEASRAGRSGSWRAAAWLLERIFPEDYSPRASEREKFQMLAAQRDHLEYDVTASSDSDAATTAHHTSQEASAAAAAPALATPAAGLDGIPALGAKAAISIPRKASKPILSGAMLPPAVTFVPESVSEAPDPLKPAQSASELFKDLAQAA